MAAHTDTAVDIVRTKRRSIDERLQLLRRRLGEMDPRHVAPRRWAPVALPIAAGGAGLWWLTRSRRAIRSLGDLLVAGLEELDGAECQIAEALPRLAARAADPELRRALEQHERETAGHIERLERVFRSMRAARRGGRTAAAVTGLLTDARRLLRHKAAAEVTDAALVAAAQRVEHYEIAAYRSVRAQAEALGYTYAADLLQQTLDEECAMDERLARLADRFVNRHAVQRRA